MGLKQLTCTYHHLLNRMAKPPRPLTRSSHNASARNPPRTAAHHADPRATVGRSHQLSTLTPPAAATAAPGSRSLSQNRGSFCGRSCLTATRPTAENAASAPCCVWHKRPTPPHRAGLRMRTITFPGGRCRECAAEVIFAPGQGRTVLLTAHARGGQRLTGAGGGTIEC